MPSVCAVAGCENKSGRKLQAWREGKPRLSCFGFPRDPELRALWLARCGRDRTNPVTHGVCQLHFRHEDLDPSYLVKRTFLPETRPRLRPDAVPSRYLPPSVVTSDLETRGSPIVVAAQDLAGNYVLDLPEDLAGNAPDLAEDLAGGAPDLAEDLAGGAPDLTEDLAGGAAGLAEDLAGGAAGLAEDLAGGAPDLAEDLAGDAPDMAEDLAGGAPDLAEDLAGGAPDWLLPRTAVPADAALTADPEWDEIDAKLGSAEGASVGAGPFLLSVLRRPSDDDAEAGIQEGESDDVERISIGEESETSSDAEASAHSDDEKFPSRDAEGGRLRPLRRRRVVSEFVRRTREVVSRRRRLRRLEERCCRVLPADGRAAAPDLLLSAGPPAPRLPLLAVLRRGAGVPAVVERLRRHQLTDAELLDTPTGLQQALLDNHRLKLRLLAMQSELLRWAVAEKRAGDLKVKLAAERYRRKAARLVSRARLRELLSLERGLRHMFTEAQVRAIARRHGPDAAAAAAGGKGAVWSDEDVRRVLALRAVGSERVVEHVRREMHIPLPSLLTARKRCERDPELGRLYLALRVDAAAASSGCKSCRRPRREPAPRPGREPAPLPSREPDGSSDSDQLLSDAEMPPAEDEWEEPAAVAAQDDALYPPQRADWHYVL